MSFSGIPESTASQLTTAHDDNSYCEGNLGLGGFSYLDPSNIAGPSQPYFGVDVWGDFSNYPDFGSPSSAPMSLLPVNGGYPSEGYDSSYQGISAPSFFPSPPPAIIPFHALPLQASPTHVPTLSHGTPSLSPDSYALPITPTSYSYAQDQAITYPDSLELGFPATAENFSLPVAHHPPAYDLSLEELWYQCSQSGPQYFGIPFPDRFPDGAPPEIPAPAPVASSSGPQRTRQSTREERRYNPVSSANKPASKKDGWNQTLARFRVELDAEPDTLRSVHDGQSSGGLVPEMALASINNIAKDDLKRSPLRGFKAGEGTRSRNGEKYLEGLLQAILPMEPTSTWSHENDTTIATLSRLANELEGRLTAVNPQPALLQASSASKAGTKGRDKRSERQERRNQMEKNRRERERHQLERITRLFKVASSGKPWSRKNALSLGVLFLLYGPTAFPQGFVEVRPAAQTS